MHVAFVSGLPCALNILAYFVRLYFEKIDPYTLVLSNFTSMSFLGTLIIFVDNCQWLFKSIHIITA